MLDRLEHRPFVTIRSTVAARDPPVGPARSGRSASSAWSHSLRLEPGLPRHLRDRACLPERRPSGGARPVAGTGRPGGWSSRSWRSPRSARRSSSPRPVRAPWSTSRTRWRILPDARFWILVPPDPSTLYPMMFGLVVTALVGLVVFAIASRPARALAVPLARGRDRARRHRARRSGRSRRSSSSSEFARAASLAVDHLSHHPDRDHGGDPPVSPLRDRPDHQPDDRLRHGQR